MKSMTAFASVSKDVDGFRISCDLKSLNQRYLDMYFKLPDGFKMLEGVFRKYIKDKIIRGKLECFIKIEPINLHVSAVAFDENIIRTYLIQGQKISDTFSIANDLSLSALTLLPGVVVENRIENDALNNEIQSIFQEAIIALIVMRESEGLGIKQVLREKLEHLCQLIILAHKESAESYLEAKKKLALKLKDFLDITENTRLEQECALILTKLDVTEELDRLKLHCDAIRLSLEDSGQMGRRLDFLMQELNREANTLSSKSESYALTQIAVDMKVVIENMREQIQNIE